MQDRSTSGSPAEGGLVEGRAQIVVERPNPGLERGLLPAPAWAVELLAGALLLITAGSWILRRRTQRARLRAQAKGPEPR